VPPLLGSRLSGSSPEECDHTSVGLLVWRVGKLLLIERKRPPFGFAAPAGHVDDHGSFEDAAIAELGEEVGLHVERLKLVIEGRKDNPCRRKHGTWHYWKIYEAVAPGRVTASHEETKQIRWCSVAELNRLRKQTERYLAGAVTEPQWIRAPGLEPVWREWLAELNYFDGRRTAE
jgi:ADP-ribose pyrophosphatase YjhB (NUDIX family)